MTTDLTPEVIRDIHYIAGPLSGQNGMTLEQDEVEALSRHLASAAEREAAARKRVEEVVERAAAIIEDGFRCDNCGALFLVREGHPDPECDRPSWDSATREEKVAMVRALSTSTEQEKG